jgi:hypothetical protein
MQSIFVLMIVLEIFHVRCQSKVLLPGNISQSSLQKERQYRNMKLMRGPQAM